MVEVVETYQSHGVVNEDDILLIRRLDTFRIHDTSTRSSKVGRTTPISPMDIIWEWEERV